VPLPSGLFLLGVELLQRFCFFLGAMISFKALAGGALTTFLAGILMTAPIWEFGGRFTQLHKRGDVGSEAISRKM